MQMMTTYIYIYTYALITHKPRHTMQPCLALRVLWVICITWTANIRSLVASVPAHSWPRCEIPLDLDTIGFSICMPACRALSLVHLSSNTNPHWRSHSWWPNKQKQPGVCAVLDAPLALLGHNSHAHPCKFLMMLQVWKAIWAFTELYQVLLQDLVVTRQIFTMNLHVQSYCWSVLQCTCMWPIRKPS